MNIRASLMASIALIGGFVLSGQATAQTSQAQPAEPQPPSASTDQSGDEVADIVVTAQRRETSLQKTPIAVTALSAAALEQGNIASTQDLMQVVPSLQVSTQSANDGGGSASFFLRGMGQQRSSNGSGPAVGIYVDDFYYPSLQGSIFDIVDLASVEVLRGPQGTLFGRNTIGGAIRYNSAQPELDAVSGRVTATYGSYNRVDATGFLNMPIGDMAAIRISGGHLQRDGFVQVQTGGPEAGATKTDLARVQALVEPAPNLKILITGLYDDSRVNGLSYNIPGPLTPGSNPTLPFIYNRVVAPALGLPLYTDALRSTCFYCQPGTEQAEFSSTRYYNALGTIAWQVAPFATLKSLTGRQWIDSRFAFDLDGTVLPIYYSGVRHVKEDSFSQEFQVSGAAISKRLNYVAGLYYFYDNQPTPGQETSATVLAAPAAAVIDQSSLTRSYAGYFDVSFELLPKLTIIGGYRHSADRRRTDIDSVDIHVSKTFLSDTWRAGLQYQWTPQIMTYATVSTGFRSGGFNPYQANINAAVPYDPEAVTSYEAGARLQLFDRRLTINPTAFYYEWSDIQVQAIYIPPTSALSAIVLQNAGRARAHGFELEASLVPTSGVRVFGNLATLNIHYTDIGSATGITLNSRFQRAPSLTWSMGASYTKQLGGARALTGSINWSFQAQQASTPTDADALLLPAYHLLNARLELKASSHVSFALFGTNLANGHYAIGGVNYYSNAGAAHYDLGRPREFGVSGRFAF